MMDRMTMNDIAMTCFKHDWRWRWDREGFMCRACGLIEWLRR